MLMVLSHIREWLVDNTPTEYNTSGHLSYRDLPVFHVVANYVVQVHIPFYRVPVHYIFQLSFCEIPAD